MLGVRNVKGKKKERKGQCPAGVSTIYNSFTARYNGSKVTLGGEEQPRKVKYLRSLNKSPINKRAMEIGYMQGQKEIWQLLQQKQRIRKEFPNKQIQINYSLLEQLQKKMERLGDNE